jgi:glycosyltransferase involved in cell wall biosynthesis
VSGPAISVCIPAYGRPEELRQAIESVLSQGFDDVEVVVGDDSGDLEPVAAVIGDPRVCYRRNESRLGMAGNWTSVLDRARGRYLALLMDDDRLLPGYLEKTVAALDADPALGVVFTDHLDDEQGTLRRRHCGLAGGRYERFAALYVEHMPVAVSAAAMRREVWAQLRPLPDVGTADVVMHARAAELGWPFLYIDEPLMVYRRHAGQLSSAMRFRDDVVEAWELIVFTDPRAEAMRRRRLAEALCSRAAARLKAGRASDARVDIARAAELDGAAIGARGRTVRFLAHHPALGRAATNVAGRARLIST